MRSRPQSASAALATAVLALFACFFPLRAAMAQTPTLSSLSPNSGTTAGGTLLTFTGTNFSGSAAVVFPDGCPATSVTIVNSTTITAVAPAQTAGDIGGGTVTLAVTVLGITTDLTATYTYVQPPAPTLTSLSPNSGTTAGGTLLTFTGTNFAGNVSVIFPDGSPATHVTLVNPTTITAIAPAQTAGDIGGGTVHLTITEGINVTDLTAAYTYVQPPAPTLTSLSPNNGTTVGGTLLTFTGANFAGNVSVIFPDGSPATNVTLVSSTTITAIAPAQTAGDIGGGTVHLTITEGITVTDLTAAYSYVQPPAPTLTSLSPNSGTTAGGTLLTFTGTNFAGNVSVIFPDGSPATHVTLVNPTTITAIAPAQTAGDIGGGTVHLAITEGITVTDLSATYTYVQPPAPTLTSLSPNKGTSAGGTLLTFTGTNFAGNVSVVFPDGSPATNVTLVNSTTITAIAPAQTAGDIGGGTVHLAITEGITVTDLTATYTYVPFVPPTLTSLSPNSGPAVGGALLTFTGANFAGSISVIFPDGSPATNVTLVNSTTITAVSPAQTAGDVGGGTVTLALKVGTTITDLTAPYAYVRVENTHAILTSSANPASAGTPVMFTATITSGGGGTPTGIVTFKDGAAIIGSASLANGIATFTTSALAVGTHSITAAYAGVLGYAASTSAALAQAISVPTDSLKLRALQIEATKVVAQSSGQAISSAIDTAISEGFSDTQQPISPSGNGIWLNFAADPAADPTQSNNQAAPAARNRFDDAMFSPSAPRGQQTARADDPFSALAYTGNVTKAAPRPEPREWLAWADVQTSGIAHWDAAGAGAPTLYGSQVNALTGLTHRLLPTFLVGALSGYETFDYRSDALAGRLKGGGWTVGSYLGWKFLPGLRFDAAAAYSRIGYDGVAGTASGMFNGNRWLVMSGLTGTYRTYGFDVEPSTQIYALWEHENAYADSLGTMQDARTFTTGRASAGMKVARAFSWTPDVVIAPYAGFYADYYFTGDDAAAVALPGGAPLTSEAFLDGWSARATGGFAARFRNGAAFTLGGEFGGIGGNVQIWTFRGRASVPF
jgi:Bacterial Ig-like domain (group 3)/Autotransporter beta-domain/IPT/TIG domain